MIVPRAHARRCRTSVRRWRWRLYALPDPAAWLLGLVALGSIVAFLAAVFWQTPAGYSYHGYIMLSEDVAQYLAAIQQGAHGQWLYHDQFTTEPAPPIFMYSFYLIGGRIFAPLHLSPPVVFDLLHVLAAVALVCALWAFVRTYVPGHALIAYALVLFGGSLAVIPITWTGGRALLPYLTPELGTIQTLLFSVHGCAGLAAQALCFVAYRRMRGWRRALTMAACLGVLACSYPFTVPVVCGAVLLDASWTACETRRMSRDDLALLLLIVPLAAALSAYYWFVFHVVPYWRASGFLHLDVAQPSVLPWTFGALALLALPNLRSRSSRLPLLWVAVTVAFMVSHVAQPPRVLAGLWLPLAVMAAETLGRIRPSSARLLAVCALSMSGLLMPYLLSNVVAQNAGRYPLFQPLSVDGVGTYLASHASAKDVVLASYLVSNMLAGEAPMRVVAGHPFQTLDLATAGPAQARYALAPASERHAIERRYGVTYLVVDKEQKALLAHIAADPRYRLRYANSDYELYSVNPTHTAPKRLASRWGVRTPVGSLPARRLSTHTERKAARDAHWA